MIDGSFVWFERSSLLGVWLPLSPPCGLRWIKSGQVETVSYFDTCSCSCNDGYPKVKVTKRSKPPIYIHLHAEQYYLKITSKTWFLEQDLSTPIHCQLCQQWRHSSDCLAVCIYVIDFSWLMTSQKMYVYFTLLRDGTRRHRHGKIKNQWLFPKNDWITLKCHWSTAAGRLEKKKIGIMVIVGSLSSEKKRKTDDVCFLFFLFCDELKLWLSLKRKPIKLK